MKYFLRCHKNFLITFLIILIFRLVFMVTYPLNVAGDGDAYFRMIGYGRSHLIHASGYPFIFGLPFQIYRSITGLQLTDERLKKVTQPMDGSNEQQESTLSEQEKKPLENPSPNAGNPPQIEVMITQKTLDLVNNSNFTSQFNTSFNEELFVALKTHLNKKMYFQQLLDELKQKHSIHLSDTDKKALLRASILREPQYSSKKLLFRLMLLITQHSVDLLMIVALFFLVQHIFGQNAAILSILLYGLDVFNIAYVSQTRPAWFQGVLLVFFLWSIHRAYQSTEASKKITSYALSAFIFSWMVLVKYNAFMLVPVYLVTLLHEKTSWKIRIISLTVISFVFLSVVQSYILFFHKPTTGTKDLNYDSGLIMRKVAPDYTPEKKLSAQMGIHTKRYLVVGWLLHDKKPVLSQHSVYEHIDSLPPEYRAPYRQKYLYLLDADHKVLDDLIKTTNMPDDYAGDYTKVVYFLGLKVADQLGKKMFFEVITQNFLTYLKITLAKCWNNLFRPFIPTYLVHANYGWGENLQNNIFYEKQYDALLHQRKVILHDEVPRNILNFGFVEYFNETTRTIGYERTILWKPGVILFSLLAHLRNPLSLLNWICLGLLLVLALKKGMQESFTQENTGIIIYLVCMIIGFIIGSNSFFHFRSNELRFIQPVLSTLTGVSLIWIYQALLGKRKVPFPS